MGNRSKYVAFAAVAVGGGSVMARRRARLRRMAAGIHDAILPTEDIGSPSLPTADLDDAHAPGHQHLPRDADEPAPTRLRIRPWTKHAHGMTHPFSGS